MARWSTDGQLLAYQRSLGKLVDTAYQFAYSVELFDMNKRQASVLMENQQVTGLAWRPGSHQLAFTLPTDPNYWSGRGQINPAYTTGIWYVDADNPGAAPVQLVGPEGGATMVNPRWSPDGRYISFEEVVQYEGRGNFGFYEPGGQGYQGWGKAIGAYDWSPDSQQLTYDYMTYAANGEERVYLNNPEGSAEQPFSPQDGNGYSFSPLFSPDGSQIAYLVSMASPFGDQTSSGNFTVMRQMIGQSQPLEMPAFMNASDLSWSADGKNLILAVGPYEARQIVELSVEAGTVRILTQGSFPVVQPPAQ